jgi:WD40 repeat protein
MTLQIHSGHRGPVYALEPGTATGSFFSASGDGLVVRWNIAAPDHGEQVVDAGQAIFSMHHSPQRNMLLLGTEGGDLHVIDLAVARETQLIRMHHKGIFRIMSLDADRFVCAGGDGYLSCWQWTDGRAQLLRSIPLGEDKLRDLALSPDGSSLAVAVGDGTIRILDTTLFNEAHTLIADTPKKGSVPGDEERHLGISALAYHPSKQVLVSGGKDGHLRLWHVGDEYRAILAMPAHKGTIYAIRFSPDGGICATASRDKTAKLWDPSDFSPLARLDRDRAGHSHSVNALLWCNDLLLSAGDDRSIRAWQVPG